MNIYLLDLIGKWISIAVVAIASFFGIIKSDKTTGEINNIDKNKNSIIINKVIDYTTEYQYASNIPSSISKVLINGEDGIIYQDQNGNVSKVIKEMKPQVVLKGTASVGEYLGRMTGYGADCYGCSKVGNVACRTKNGTNHSLINDGMYYNDDDFGTIRILAADNTLFPCGTILKVELNNGEPFYGVVLDTGSAMRTAWRERGEVLIDLAFVTGSDPGVREVTQRDVKYTVQRWGF